MDRKQFLKTCSFGCLAGITGINILQSCSTPQILTREINGTDILVPLSDFVIQKKDSIEYKKYIIIQNQTLKAPIYVYRFDIATYTAVLMSCTHQGSELQAFGDKLQCPAHGSEFSNHGDIENGPASENLKKFPILIENSILKISLK